MSAPILGDAQIANELSRLGIEAADVKSAMAGNGPAFQQVLWLFLERVAKFDRFVLRCELRGAAVTMPL
jgi:hypothetical protein